MSPTRRGTGAGRVAHATCLGCGCACDDIVLTVRNDRIVGAEHACPLGLAWFGDGRVPAEVRVEGRAAALDEAVSVAGALLGGAMERLFVFLGDDITVAAQRAALGIADRMRAAVHSVVSEAAAGSILAAQRRGRATATLGEIRNRADVVVYWGVDPDLHYPRFRSRYAGYPSGLHLRRGAHARTVIAVDIGADAGPPDAELRYALAPDEELAAIAELRALLAGRTLGMAGPRTGELAGLMDRLRQARYATLVVDGEGPRERRPPDRTEALLALVQALNGPTRAAISVLRGGGNRSGAEAVMTWQTGYPFAVDFSHGFPRYQPDRRGPEFLAGRRFAAALVAGNPASVPEPLRGGLGSIPTVVVGPRASQSPFSVRVALDTGVAAIHEAGVGYRMDDVPLPLPAVLSGPPAAAEILGRLAALLPGKGP